MTPDLFSLRRPFFAFNSNLEPAKNFELRQSKLAHLQGFQSEMETVHIFLILHSVWRTRRMDKIEEYKKSFPPLYRLCTDGWNKNGVSEEREKEG